MQGPLDPEPIDHACPICAASGRAVVYRLDSLPVQSNLLMQDRRQALECDRGRMALAECSACGFIENVLFDPTTQEHSSRYEITQGFSASFGAFIEKLAHHLINQHGVRNKRVVEIGCGSGEFLSAICTLGDNVGIGIDPIVDPDRLSADVRQRIQLRREYWSPAHASLEPDLVACRHTLEHIPTPRAFVGSIRAAMTAGTLAFLEVPDSTRIFRDGAFWDIYYEHCCYFTPSTLALLLETEGFELLEQEVMYDGQYLVVTARAAGPSRVRRPAPFTTPPEDAALAFARTTTTWRDRLERWQSEKQQVALWGAGSKACGFLTTLGIADEVSCVVDINPYKQGMYSAGTGHPIVAPESLREYRPDVVVVMNPVYVDEIVSQLSELGLASTDVVPIE
jgi:hypothetical protein